LQDVLPERFLVPDLVIFDCDGVLLDSEVIFAGVLRQCLTEAGFAASDEEALDLGFGRNRDTLSEAVAERFGRNLPEDFFETMRPRAALALERELQPIPGVEALLAGLAAARCVASNGHLPRVRERLALVGLLDHFEPHVFSATQVARGKPAPDLFLFAAGRLGVDPARCLVVEDSTAGVAAAVAAHMPVVGFCGGGHCRDGHSRLLIEAGCARVFARMADLDMFLREAT
jgi:HAD superfamily hydrolase (TIGR01509 family)